MIIGIMCAVPRETAPVLQVMENKRTETLMQRTFHIGTICGAEVVVVQSGVGKVNASITAQFLAEHYHVDKIIFTGTAGGMDDSLQIGDVVIGTTLLYHDLSMELVGNGVFDTPLDGFHSDGAMVDICRKADIPLHFGTIITGDEFVYGDRRNVLNERFHPLCVDMESTAVAQVCWFYKLPLLVIRIVSDFADDAAEYTFERNATKMGKLAVSVLKEVVAGL